MISFLFHLLKSGNKTRVFVRIYYIGIYESGKYSKGVILGHNFVYLAMYCNMGMGTNNRSIYVKLDVRMYM